MSAWVIRLTVACRSGDVGAPMSVNVPGGPCGKTIVRTGYAWTFLPHDLARSKTYLWGEDGLAGICDRFQLLNFSLGLWNTRAPFLKDGSSV